MNRVKLWLRSLLLRWESSLRTRPPTPDLTGVIRTLGDQLKDSQTLRDLDRLNYVERCHELVEARAMQGSGPWHGSGGATATTGELVGVRESFNGALGSTGDLELMLNNVEWRREINLSWMEFSRWGIQQIMLISRLYYIKNPIIRRLINVDAYYVFGRGVEISSDDASLNDAIADFLKLNEMELGQVALSEHQKRTNYDGNLFFVFFPDTQDTGTVPVRTIDAAEIQEIITNPEDTNEKWYFRRTWTERVFNPDSGQSGTKSREAWYPAMGFEPTDKPQTINGHKVMWESPVYHRKYGAVGKWLFGCPVIYPALDWAKADLKYLEACATLAASHAQIAMTLTTKGGQQALAGVKQQLETMVGPNTNVWDSNPTAVNASIFASGPGTALAAFHSRGQGLDPKEHKEYAAMAAMCMDVPPTFLGDMETANLATATSLDRPTELAFMHKQEAWRELLVSIVTFAMTVQLRAAGGKLREALAARNIDVSKVRIVEAPRGAKQNGGMMYLSEASRKSAGKPKQATDLEITVTFPPILEGDMPALMGALIEAITLNGFEATGIDPKTGIKAALSLVNSFSNLEIDVDEVIEKMYPDARYAPLMDRTPALKFQQEQALIPPPVAADPAASGAEGPTGAAPHAPQPRKPHPRKIDASTNAESLGRLEGAMNRLREVLRKKAA